MDESCLAERVVLFSRFLKNHGFNVFSSNTVDSLRGLQEIDISKREDFLAVLRANLVTRDLEWELFVELFEEFWKRIDSPEEEERGEGPEEDSECQGDSMMERLREMSLDPRQGGEEPREDTSVKEATYSPVSVMAKRDLAQFQKGDIQIAQLILKNIMTPFRTTITRRFRRSKQLADMDFRRTIRNSLKTGGIPLELAYKKKKKRLKRLVILADVSGSMDRYARFVMPFILGLKGVGARAEVFVFSTCLTAITQILRGAGIEQTLERISCEVPDWSGGTRIGHSLHEFNQAYGERLLNKRTVVVIMSDGWDLGGRELLKREMEYLSRKAHCVIWLNPLAGDAEYKPVCQGMQVALPFVDYFLPADSLESLKKVGRTISRVMIR
jgi:uncharacterized protein with von Willebrand factor type A (vWA) domain